MASGDSIMVVRECQLCEGKGKDKLIVVTSKGREVCWECVAEAVSLYEDMLKEDHNV